MVQFTYSSDSTQRELVYAIAKFVYESRGYRFSNEDVMSLWRSRQVTEIEALLAAEKMFAFLTGNKPDYLDEIKEMEQVDFFEDRTDREAVYEIAQIIHEKVARTLCRRQYGESIAQSLHESGEFNFPENDLMYPWRSHDPIVVAALNSSVEIFKLLIGSEPNYLDDLEEK